MSGSTRISIKVICIVPFGASYKYSEPKGNSSLRVSKKFCLIQCGRKKYRIRDPCTCRVCYSYRVLVAYCFTTSCCVCTSC